MLLNAPQPSETMRASDGHKGVFGETRSEAAERRRLEQDIRLAVERDGFILHYQPRRHLRSRRVMGAEALIRWPHRKRGLVPPAAFIPIAERSDLITAIGGWVLTTACREAAAWPEEEACPTVLSVNIATRQLQDGALLAQLAEALEISGLPPERLDLEVTEQMLVDPSLDMLLMLAAIRDLGVGLTIDDFGAGFASIAMLRRLPLTAMKLDRTLTRTIPGKQEDAVIARAVIDTGHALGLTVVAEGIETEEQLAFLSAAGCDEGQGYVFAHALPPEHLRARLGAADVLAAD